MKKTRHLAGWGRTTFILMTAVCLSLWVTGLVMFEFPVSELMDMTPAQALLRHNAGVVHGVASWFFCVMCGRGVWPHVRVMWHKQGEATKWVLGMINLVVLAFIALGGLVLLYGSPEMHDWISPFHFWMGVVCALIFLAHTWRRFLPSIGA